MVKSNNNKTEKRSEEIIPWRQHHLRLDVTVRKLNSPYRHDEEVDDAVVVALIFIRVAMKKPNTPYLFAVAKKDKKETNPQYQETWHGETLTPLQRFPRRSVLRMFVRCVSYKHIEVIKIKIS
jgi:hypothetical protein